MTPDEALGIAVQVAVALAGFTGIVVVFGTTAVHEWRPLDKLRLRLLLATSTLPLGLCLIAILLLSTDLPQHAIWRTMSGISACAFSSIGVIAQRGFQRLNTKELIGSPGSRAVFNFTALVGAVTILLLIYDVVALGVFWPFFAAIVWSMLAALLQFVRLISLQPGRSSV